MWMACSRTSASTGLADRRQPNIATGVVDDLQHGLPKRSILEAELGKQAAVIEKVGGVGCLGAGLSLEMNPGIRKVRTDDVSDLPQTDRCAAAVIDAVGRAFGQQHAAKD